MEVKMPKQHSSNPHEKKDLENKAKQLDRACQKLDSDLHKKSIDAKTLQNDCQEICRIGHECESCCKKMH